MNEYKFSDIELGMEKSFQADITEETLEKFKEITKDINPLHNDAKFAKEMGYPDRVVYGGVTSSFLSTLAGVYLPGKYSLIHSEEILFKKPVYLVDSPLTIKGKVTEIYDSFKQFKISFSIYNNKNEKVCRGTMKVGVLDNE